MGSLLRRVLESFRKSPPVIPEPTWRAALEALPFIACRPPGELAELRELVSRFLEDKVFAGAQGFEPDDFARLSIAMQACLPVLRLGLTAYAGWQGIIVYPGGFVIPRRVVDDDGVQHEYDEEALGEAWDGGPVVLSWYDDPADYAGANVVIHEFAHKLDMLGGEADGIPPLHGGLEEEEWIAVLDAAYDDFCERIDGGEETCVDPYAATHAGEFFAVMSEVFFTEPAVMIDEYPDLYALFRRFYLQDPASYMILRTG